MIASEVVIRRAEPGDLEALIRLEEAAFTADRMTPRSLARLLRAGRNDLLVAAQADGRLSGAVVLLRRRGSRQERVYSLAVDPSARGRGIARALLEAALEAASGRGAERVVLEVRPENGAALALYERAGFVRTHLSPGYYADGSAAVRMAFSFPGRG